jgi:hypothetical protein
MRMSGYLMGLKFAKDPYKKKLDEAIQRLIRECAREWLRAMIVRIPVWTGHTKGSIKFASGTNGNLGRYLNVSIPISPHPGAARQIRQGKTAASGGRKGRYSFTVQNHVYRFYFRSDVIYFLQNDFFARTDRGAGGQQILAPWGSAEAGAAAFRAALIAGKRKLPRIQDAIVTTRIPFPVGA